MADNKIRVHNSGKRDFTLLPAKEGGKNRLLPSGRAIEIEESYAKRLLKDYPKDLIEFDSLVSGEKKNLTKENARLEAEVEALKKKLAEATKEATEEKTDPPKETKESKKSDSKKKG